MHTRPEARRPIKDRPTSPVQRAAPPHVEIHIGTIEIVAETPPAPPESRRAQVDRGISLDDFLDAGRGR